MARQQGIVRGDALQKVSSAGFIVGAILLVIGNLLMPYTTNPTSNLREMLKPLGEQTFRTQASVLLITFGILGLMVGAAGVYRSITSDGAAWARLGFYLIVVGTALWTVSLSLDVAVANAVADWLAAPAAGKEAAWNVVASLSAVGRGIVPMTWIVYWLAFAILGIAMAYSAVYPRWLGWAGLTLSVPVVAVGIIQTFTARTTTLTFIYVVLALLTDLWAIAVGIWMVRGAWKKETEEERQTRKPQSLRS